jgi:T5SS/PEP-CTERM-associated repeat protein
VGRPVNANAPGDISGVFIGSRPGGNASAIVRGAGSLLDGGVFVGVAVGLDRVSDGGTGTLTVRDGGVVKGDAVRIGSGGILSGNGTVIGNVVNAGGIIAPGNSPGTLTIQGSLESHGLIQIQVEGLNPGQFDVLNVLGDAVLAGSTIEFIFQNGYLPKLGDSFDFLSGNTNQNPLAGVLYEYTGAAPGFLFNVDPNTGVFVALNNAAPAVPEPEPFVLLAIGLVAVALVRIAKHPV